MSWSPRICLIGFGEVGQTLAADLVERGHDACDAWDILFPDPTSGPRRAAATGLARPRGSAAEAAAGADLVISAVTAAQCVAAAHSVSGALAPGAWYLDLNSVAPGTKAEAARAVEDRGGCYVEAAVMSPIGPKRIATPMLLGGPHAGDFVELAQVLGLAGARAYSEVIGRASAAKMCRSVMVKGLEALVTESLVAARHYGVEHTVLDSLRDLFPGADRPALARYMISRSLQHGRRRAEEMREVARTVSEAGIEPDMSAAAARRHDWASTRADAAGLEPLEALLDALLASTGAPSGETRC